MFLQTRELAVRFGRGSTAGIEFDDISCEEAELVVVTGKNGSGKTTLASLIAGQRNPSAGTVSVCGFPAGSAKARARLSYIPDRPALYDELTVAENCAYLTELSRGIQGASLSPELIADLELEDVIDKVPFALSKGQRKKAAIAIGLSQAADLICLDEPTDGLDEDSQQGFHRAVERATKAGSCVLIMTHDQELIATSSKRIELN